MTSLAEAALRALDGLEPSGDEAGREPTGSRGRATVSRVSLEVVAEGRSEIVTVALREGRLLCCSTDGRTEGPHVVAALRLLAGVSRPTQVPRGQMKTLAAESEPAATGSAEPSHSARPDGALEGTRRRARAGGRIATERQESTRADRAAAVADGGDRLAAELDDIVTAIARVGLSAAPNAPSVAEALDRLIAPYRLAASPREPGRDLIPLELARWIGRLREAFSTHQPELVIRLLDGATRVATALEEPGRGEGHLGLAPWACRPSHACPDRPAGRLTSSDPTSKYPSIPSIGSSGRARPANLSEPAGLGDHACRPSLGARVYERRMVEVGREWLTGLTRFEIQRRYLMDLDGGAIYREERHRDKMASVGPCPRKLLVGLATSAPGAPPTPLRLLQYQIAPGVDPDAWRTVDEHAARDFAALLERYGRVQRSSAGLAEPFVLLAPANLDRSPQLVVSDERGRLLPIVCEDSAAAAVLDAACATELPRWIGGRLVEDRGTLSLVPVAAVFGTPEATLHLRLG